MKKAEWISYSPELTQEVIQEWSQSPKMTTVEAIEETTLFEEEEDDDEDGDATSGSQQDETPEVYIEHMDIREPIIVLREMLAAKVNIPLDNFAFWLQNTSMVSVGWVNYL